MNPPMSPKKSLVVNTKMKGRRFNRPPVVSINSIKMNGQQQLSRMFNESEDQGGQDMSPIVKSKAFGARLAIETKSSATGQFKINLHRSDSNNNEPDSPVQIGKGVNQRMP